MSSNGTTRISQERLNQIAQRKLAALGVPHRTAADGGLEGELPLTPGRVSHPANGTALSRAPFRVMGHDHLCFTESPFSGLAPVQFYDLDSKAMLESRTLQLLQQRVQLLRELDGKLKALGQTSNLDVELLCLRTVVKGTEQSYELIAGPEGVRVSQVIPRHGEPLPFPDALPVLLPLDELTTAAELELYLESSAELRAAPGPAAAPAPSPGARTLRVLPAPAGALRLSALSRFADEGAFLQGNELVLELESEGRRYRFTAVHERDTTFQGRLVGPTGEKWKERFDAARFPGIVPFARSLLDIPAEPERPAPAPPGSDGPARSVTSPSLPAHLTPQPGEVWVMNVLVERDDGQEVRYVCTNVDGHPYGAARILAKADFAAVFAPHGTGWRLRIRITELDAEGVSYRQLSPQGELSPTAKKIALNIFAANFLSEAAAYSQGVPGGLMIRHVFRPRVVEGLARAWLSARSESWLRRLP